MYVISVKQGGGFREDALDAAVGRTRADHNPLGGRAASEVDHHGRSRASLGGTNWRDFSTGLLEGTSGEFSFMYVKCVSIEPCGLALEGGCTYLRKSITVRCYTQALRRDPQDAKGMTTDVYPRENCIAPDMA